MKILQINIFGNLSTGRIAVDLYRTLHACGHEGVIAYARNTIAENIPSIRVGNKWSIYADGIMSRLTDRAGFYSRAATKKLIRQIQDYDPDIIHLHNLHGYYLNIELLFEYLRESAKPVIWTLHDCWAFTGHCCYYSAAGCGKWKTGCSRCGQKHTYPKSMLVDNSKRNYLRKKELFTSLPHLHLVCVSDWLAEEVKQSFLKNLPCEVIHNGIDTKAFRFTESNFRKKYRLENKKIVLAVSTSWNDKRKGLDDVLQLASIAEGKYTVVIVGVSEDRKKQIGDKALAITRTDSTKELAEIYSSADVFFNASVEETFGLPTVEAIACGTPVIVYDSTALPEAVTDACGFVVKPHDVQAVRNIILSDLHFDRETVCACAAKYSKEAMMQKYLRTYKRLSLQS